MKNANLTAKEEFYNIYNEDIDSSFKDVCLEFGMRQSSAISQFYFTFIYILFSRGVFNGKESLKYSDNYEVFQSDFIDAYQKHFGATIDKYHLIGIIYHVIDTNIINYTIDGSGITCLSDFVKHLSASILDDITDPLWERYIDHLCFYYECDSDHDLWDFVDLDEEREKITNRDFENLAVYFNPESLYDFGENTNEVDNDE